MKTTDLISIRVAVFVSIICLATGCHKPSDLPDQGWTPPVAVASSIEGLMGWVDLHEYQDTLVGVNVLRNESAQLLILNRVNGSWSKLSMPSVANGYVWSYVAIDPQNKRILLPQAYVENEELVMSALMAAIAGKAGLQNVSETKWITDKIMLFGKTASNVELNYLGRGRQDVGLGQCILNGSEACIPFFVDAAEVTRSGQQTTIDRTKGPFFSGVAYSADSGRTWRIERVSNVSGAGADGCRTTEYFYYFGGIYPWWSSRRARDIGQWEKAQEITETFSRAYGRCNVAGEGQTAHACWMDRRHDKWRFNPAGPRIENCDIYYRHRKDSESEWGKEVWLSKGLLYCYAPTIAAEADNVVAAWAGIRDAGKQHTDMGPNDVYYVTSKDGGATWTKPLKVTDGAKDGSTAGMPQVALLNGTIHLLYTQGPQATRTELSPGLTKLGGDPWPIYYTRRPFPN